ncbi:MAG TPA: condensation domain-containing protein, partial [Cytophagales bacterium]
ADRVEACVGRLIARHDVLRMHFRRNPEPTFAIAERVDFSLPRTVCGPDGLEERLRGLVSPFDLAQAPLLRAHLLTVGPQEHVLFLDFHHIIADGVSVSHFLHELFGLYTGAELPPLPIGYKDYVAWEEQQRAAPALREQESFWLGQLQGELPLLDLPLDFARPAVFDPAGARLTFAFDKNTTGRLRQLAAAHGCSLHVLLFTVYNVLLWKYTGQDDLVVGIPVAGRRHADLQKLLGMFVNNLPVRSTLRGEESFAQLLEREKDNVARALDNQDYPFEALTRQVVRQRDVSRNPVFDTMFVYQQMPFPGVAGPGLALSRHCFDPGFAKFDLSLEVFEDGDSLTCHLEYATQLFREETIRRLARHFTHLAGQVVQHPGAVLAELSVLDAGEREACTGAFNGSPHGALPDKTIDQLFEEQAARTPDRPALEAGGQQVTYRELDGRANGLAGLLRANGIADGSVVAILLPRSPRLVTALLGVLKAGGAYLPLDPDTPEDRLRYILADSRCQAVVTDARHLPAVAGGPGGGTGPAPRIINLDGTETGAAYTPVPKTHSTRSLAYVIYT